MPWRGYSPSPICGDLSNESCLDSRTRYRADHRLPGRYRLVEEPLNAHHARRYRSHHQPRSRLHGAGTSVRGRPGFHCKMGAASACRHSGDSTHRPLSRCRNRRRCDPVRPRNPGNCTTALRYPTLEGWPSLDESGRAILMLDRFEESIQEGYLSELKAVFGLVEPSSFRGDMLSICFWEIGASCPFFVQGGSAFLGISFGGN